MMVVGEDLITPFRATPTFWREYLKIEWDNVCRGNRVR